MSWHTEQYCATLDKLDRVDAAQAIHAAWLQLSAVRREQVADDPLDHGPAMGMLAKCLHDAGHPAFTPEVTT